MADATYELSPNARWAIYGPNPYSDLKGTKLSIVNTRTGRIHRAWDEDELLAYCWSEDSTRFAYLNSTLRVKVIDLSAEPSVKDIAKLDFPLKERRFSDVGSDLSMSWSPNGEILGILWDDHTVDWSERKYRVALVNIRTRAVSVIVYADVKKPNEAVSARGTHPVPVWGPGGERLFWPPGPENRSAR